MTKSTARTSSTETHSHLVIAVGGYEASVSARINYFAYEPQYAWRALDEEPVHEFHSGLLVSGTITSPADRAGHRFAVTLYGDTSPARDLDAKLEDIAEHDEHGVPRYRRYRGREVPVYRAPKGLGVLDKPRGEDEWSTSLFVKQTFVDRWLALLVSSRELFISLHECKVGRSRWVRAIKLGTANPDDE